MFHSWPARGLAAVWVLALITGTVAARYFLVPPPLLVSPIVPNLIQRNPAGGAIVHISEYLYAHHRPWFLLHIGGGIVALTVGLFQFVPRLRDSRPALHRILGYTYFSAILLSGSAGLPLAFLTLGAFPVQMRLWFYGMITGLASLAVAWLFITMVAVQHARRKRFAEHRAWMLRSYSLTFAAVTVRLIAPILLVLTRDPVITVNAAFLSWPLNLIAAQWLIRSNPERKVEDCMKREHSLEFGGL